jgi:tetratricopeptide (TPR) repeat protein
MSRLTFGLFADARNHVLNSAWLLLSLILSGASGGLYGQDGLPSVEDNYVDADNAAQFAQAIDPQDRRAVQQLEQLLRYDERNVPARVQNAHVLLNRGLRARAAQEFDYAIRVAEAGSRLQRYAYWNYGWALLRSADTAGAIQQWQTAAQLHGGKPDWVPPLFALAFWQSGDRELAVSYYKAAVRALPERWGDRHGMQEATKDWTANDKFALESLYAAWRESIGLGGD